MYGNGYVSECLYNAILVRRLWTVQKDVVIADIAGYAMSAITTSSGSTCQNHQESAWGAAKARQEKVTVDIVRKAIVVLKCWSIF